MKAMLQLARRSRLSPQSMPTLAEDSALRRNMPQRNDKSEDALKRHRISFSPAGAVWGKMGQALDPRLA